MYMYLYYEYYNTRAYIVINYIIIALYIYTYDRKTLYMQTRNTVRLTIIIS